MNMALAPEAAETMGERIREARVVAGITQAQLAEKIGVSRVHLCNYERGRKWPNVEMLVRICKCLGTSPNQILDFSSE